MDHPALVGVMFEPRIESPIKAEHRDMWDYVLRRMFVKWRAPLRSTISLLGFGAERLLQAIGAEDSAHGGKAVQPETKIVDIPLEGWHRIVEVFAEWPFRPHVSCFRGC